MIGAQTFWLKSAYTSYLFRTPPQFLHEIVLVDDKSEMQHLHGPLDEELRKPFYQSKVKVVRNKEREGLIRARNNGAIAASGIRCFLLSGWSPPTTCCKIRKCHYLRVGSTSPKIALLIIPVLYVISV